MKKPSFALVAILLAITLYGCRTTTVNPHLEDQKSVAPDITPLGPGKMVPYKQITNAVAKLKVNATAQDIADLLTAVEVVQVADKDRQKVLDIEGTLISQLRIKVKNEATLLHEKALKSASYREGYELVRHSGAVIALYPLSDAPEIIKEAEALSFRQNEVTRRLELIRRQRYNFWAAEQAEKALRELRENGKEGTRNAIANLRAIEPSLLESSVASLYSYAVTEIMDKFKKDEKAVVAKDLTNPSFTRRSLEDF